MVERESVLTVSVTTVILLLLYCFEVSSETNFLNGKHLKLVTSPFSPYVYIDHDQSGNLTRVYGFVNELVIWLSAKYNFTYHYVEPTDGFYGAFVNNSWNGMVKMLIDNEADMIAFCFTPTYARTLVIDFLIPFSESPMVALIPSPNEAGKAAAVVQPFKFEVWALMITSMTCVALVTWMIMNFSHKCMGIVSLYQSELRMSRHFLIAFGVISCQGQYLPQRVSHSTRLAASVWCLTSVVFIYTYSGCLISYLTVPKLHPVVETVDELANNTQLRVLTLKSHFFESYLLDAKSGPYLKIGNEIRKYPEHRLRNEDLDKNKLTSKFKSRQFALLLEKAHLVEVVEYYLKTFGECGVSIMKEEFFQSREAFAIPKGRSYLKLLDQGMNIMRDTGYIEYWDRTLNKKNKCTTSHKDKNRKVPKLGSSDLIGAFVIWIFGTVLASALFAIEFTTSYCRKRKFALDK